MNDNLDFEDLAEFSQPADFGFDSGSAPPSPPRMSAGRIIVRLMSEVEQLRRENADLRSLLTGGDPPQSPFPLLDGEEIIRILHPRGYR